MAWHACTWCKVWRAVSRFAMSTCIWSAVHNFVIQSRYLAYFDKRLGITIMDVESGAPLQSLLAWH